MTPTPTLGAQENSAYQPGKVFTLGGNTTITGLVNYPVQTSGMPGVDFTPVCIVDNIVAPTAILSRETDFMLTDNTLVVREALDPFTDPAFPSVVTNDDGEEDREVVLWACDCMFDLELVQRHVAMALSSMYGGYSQSTPTRKAELNAAWDALTLGASPGLISAATAAACGVQTVVGTQETVTDIFRDATERLFVATDARVYRFNPNAVLRDGIEVGTVVYKGDMIDSAIRVYPPLIYPTPSRLKAITGYDDVRADIPSLTLPPGVFTLPEEYSLGVDWEMVPLYADGVDANGHSRVWFPLIGDTDAVETFWDGVWARALASGTDLEPMFAEWLSNTIEVDDDGRTIIGHIEPMAFMLQHVVGANTVFVTIRLDQLPDGRGGVTRAGITRLAKLFPSYVRMVVTGHTSAGVETIDLADGTRVRDSKILLSLAAWARDTVNSVSRSDIRNLGAAAVCTDACVRQRWIPTCRARS